MKTPICLLLGLAMAVNAWPAHAAEERPLSFSWQAPSECPTNDELHAEIARLLGGTIQVAPGSELEANATVEHGEKWSVTIVTRTGGRSGRRSIEASTCQDLAMATALIIALMIDPEAVATQRKAPRTDPPEVPEPHPTPPQKQEPTREALFGLHGIASQGTLPSFDVGVGGGIGLLSRRWRAELRGTYGLRRNQQAESPGRPGAYGQFGLTTATIAGCMNVGRTGLPLGPCLDVEGGVVSARGFGVSEGFATHRLWLAVGAGAYLAPSLGRHLSLPVHVDVLMPLLRPEFVFTNVPGTVYRAPAVGGRLCVGLELHY